MLDNRNSIFPERVITTRDKSGKKFTSYDYTFESWGNIQLLTLAATLIVVTAFLPIASLLFLLFYIRRVHVVPIPNSHNLFGVICSLYLLIDYYNQWIVTIGALIVFSDENYMRIIQLNFGLILTHIILWILGSSLYKICMGSKLISFIVILLILYFSYLLSGFMYGESIAKHIPVFPTT